MNNTNTFIGAALANIYQEPAFRSAVVSQGRMWEPVQVISAEADFVRVTLPDGYSGWLAKNQLYRLDQPADYFWEEVFNPLIPALHAVENVPMFIPGPLRLPFLSPEADGWRRFLLPGGAAGMIENSQLLGRPADWIGYARLFLGVPYIWGGRSYFGLDCSGLTQLVLQTAGIIMRRDAWMQFEDAGECGRTARTAKPGDLAFFDEGQGRISHVGLCLGQGRLLHARGFVRINSMVSGEADSDEKLINTFAGIRSFF